jgi:hypothetical protein
MIEAELDVVAENASRGSAAPRRATRLAVQFDVGELRFLGLRS